MTALDCAFVYVMGGVCFVAFMLVRTSEAGISDAMREAIESHPAAFFGTLTIVGAAWPVIVLALAVAAIFDDGGSVS